MLKTSKNTIIFKTRPMVLTVIRTRIDRFNLIGGCLHSTFFYFFVVLLLIYCLVWIPTFSRFLTSKPWFWDFEPLFLGPWTLETLVLGLLASFEVKYLNFWGHQPNHQVDLGNLALLSFQSSKAFIANSVFAIFL